jgi:hypothetical protein
MADRCVVPRNPSHLQSALDCSESGCLDRVHNQVKNYKQNDTFQASCPDCLADLLH